jgi:hypothetical protein
MATERVAVQVPVRPWFRDHCFNGKIIFAAVEAMHLLAQTAQAAHPGLNVRRMHQGRFPKFLEIPVEAADLDVLVELETEKNGGVHARLLTKIQLKTMTRMTNHCELSFASGGEHDRTEIEIWQPCSTAPRLTLSAAQVYRDLVPFGPAYQTLHDRLFLAVGSVWGTLRAPDLPSPGPNPIGSPFPLDGAMHAACVHGQRLVAFVPFPVGFATRTIHKPTRAGEFYRTHVRLQSQAADEVVYDLQIIDQTEQLRETITGLRMRDVSGGRIKPPAWMQRVSSEDNGEAE